MVQGSRRRVPALRLIDALALDPPADLGGLRSVPGLRRRRVDAFGPVILAALRTP